MKKTVLFVLLEPYSDWECAYLSSLLLGLGQGEFEVKTVSPSGKSLKSMGGFTILPDYDLAAALKLSDFAGLVLVGGMSWRTPLADGVEKLVGRSAAADKVLAAICDGTVFLGRHGFLNERQHTSNDLADLQAYCGGHYTGAAHYQAQPAVRDGLLVTANGTAPLEFTREVLLALAVAPAAKIQAWYEFHKYGSLERPQPEL